MSNLIRLQLNRDELKNYIKTVLTPLESKMPSSDGCIDLLMMIAAHESGGLRYTEQTGYWGSPEKKALGLFQMEPLTGYQGVLDYLKRREDLRKLVEKALGFNPRAEHATLLKFDLRFATVMARVYLWSKPEKIPTAYTHPDADSYLESLAKYAKKYWNTELGAARASHYLDAYINLKKGL